LLTKLQQEKSPGPDGIHSRVLKECAAVLAKPLTMLFKSSLEEGQLPRAWKEANVSPIHKKGPKSSVDNYRPVSLTSVCCKVMEKVVRRVLLSHMVENGHLSDYQHGFVHGRSCTTQLLKVIDAWSEILDQGGSIDVAYLDFAKAFDTVPHQRLLLKLESYGVKGKVLKWIGEFLLGRRQRVGVAGVFSEWTEVLSGVPQGSVLGPVLFVCYINDLPESIASFIYMYADDTKLFRRVDCDLEREELQRDLDTLGDWAQKWQLRFNVEKCKVMHLGIRNLGATYEMTRADNGKRIALLETKEEKDLGVWVDNTGKPSNHVVHAANKANQLLGLIRRGFAYMDGALMKQLYTAIVRPHLEYANVVWHPYLKRDIELLERVQHRATRLVPGFAKIKYEERLRRLDLPTLAYRRYRGDAIEVFKYLKGLYEVDCSKMLPLHESVGMETRGNGMKLAKKGCNGLLRQNFFGMRVVNEWNELAEDVVQAPSVNCFKGRFDRQCAENRFSMEWKSVALRTGASRGERR
jgi:Reverse transcriptase (RNA-dependent DNA polymerase)